MKRTAGAFVCALAAVVLFPIVPVLVVAAGTASAACSTGNVQAVDVEAVAAHVRSILGGGGAGTVSVAGLGAPKEQVANAKTVVATGIAMRVPVRGQVVALAAALQESGLRNLPYGDRDSLGLFQQRPSQEWGTAEQVLDPVHASARFYAALQKVPGWQSLTVAQAAQAVQKSAAAGAYAKWEPLGTALQKAIEPLLSTPGTTGAPDGGAPTYAVGGCTSTGGSGSGAAPYGALPPSYIIPADAPRQAQVAIRWALGQLGTPYQWGGRCTDPRGPDPMGRCDCSSLVQQAYGRAGITLPRTTYEQVKQGRPVPVGRLRPGDLVFTEGSAAIPEHVGMYVGAGLIVNAPHTGAEVRVEHLASWAPRILAARRVV